MVLPINLALCVCRYNPSMLPRKMRPIRLSRRSEPFDSDQFINELKIDGFDESDGRTFRAGEHVPKLGFNITPF